MKSNYHCENTIMRKPQGFTLIELMIVVAIIAILAAIALPAYQDYTIRSQVTEGSTLADHAKTAISIFVSDRGIFPPNNASAGMAQPTSVVGNYVTQVDIGFVDGQIQVTYGNQVNAAVSGDILIFSAITHAGSLEWDCHSATIDPKYLPTSCR
jgi:type IV pilus assembly protein PilA